jgi:Ca-activated chloride channel family protein
LFSTIKNPTFLVCILATASLSQNGPAFRSNVEIVVAACAVVDASGAAVGGLTRDEFRVYDNGVPRAIENLWIDTDEPVTLGVIIDASESQKEQLAEHRQTAVELLKRLLRPGDHAFVLSVDEDVRLWVDLTEATGEVGKQIVGSPGDLFGEPCPKRKSNVAGLRPMSACGSSPIWNAIYAAARIKLHSLSGNKALLVLTDGFDSGSTHNWKDAVAAVQRADASVYAIQYQSGFGKSFAPDLYRMVGETGGTWFRRPVGDYRPIVSRIDTDLRRRYVLGFRPETLSGKLRHNIRIDVIQSDLTVRARKTYFLDPQ